MNSDYSMHAPVPVSMSSVEERADFISKTYMHLFGAMIGFVLFEAALFQSGLAETITAALTGVNWLLVLGGFMLVSWFASRTALSVESKASQYGALVAYVVVWGIMFVPLLFTAVTYFPGVLESAATVTLLGFAGLTAIAFVTRKDFSFMGGMLRWIGMVALVAIVGSVLFGFQLGTYFSVAMIAFAGGAVLYDTSNILHHYPEDKYVAAALSLFGSIALMFWYVLQLFMSRD